MHKQLLTAAALLQGEIESQMSSRALWTITTRRLFFYTVAFKLELRPYSYIEVANQDPTLFSDWVSYMSCSRKWI
jgi:hypothetical protein